jgi:hypothetical protein
MSLFFLLERFSSSTSRTSRPLFLIYTAPRIFELKGLGGHIFGLLVLSSTVEIPRLTQA